MNDFEHYKRLTERFDMVDRALEEARITTLDLMQDMRSARRAAVWTRWWIVGTIAGSAVVLLIGLSMTLGAS